MTDQTPRTSMPGACRHYACVVPMPHRHRKPNAAEVAEAESTYVIQHPPSCAWRKDIYDGCSCGVTQHITAQTAAGPGHADHIAAIRADALQEAAERVRALESFGVAGVFISASAVLAILTGGSDAE